MKFPRSKPSYASVTASLALFLSLGGVSYAAVELAANSVDSQHIRNNAVRESEVASNAIGSAELQRNSVGASELRAGAVNPEDLSDATLAQLRDAVQSTDALGSFPRVASACAYLGRTSDCQDVRGETRSLGRLGSSTWDTIDCPTGTQAAESSTNSLFPQVVVPDGSSTFTDSGTYVDFESEHRKVLVTITNWSSRASFTPTIACDVA